MGAHSLAFPFVNIECVTCLHEYFVVFRHNAVLFNLRDPLFIRPLKTFSCSHAFRKYVTRAYPHYIFLPFSRVSTSGVVVKSTVTTSVLEALRY